MKQQTAVEWLIEQYNLYRPGQMPRTTFKKVCEQAKQMEKEQTFTEQNILDAYNAGYADAQTNHISDAKNYIHELRYIRSEELRWTRLSDNSSGSPTID